MKKLDEKIRKGILRLAVEMGSIATTRAGDDVLDSLISFYEEFKRLPTELKREYEEEFLFLFSLLGDRAEYLSRVGKERFLEYASSDPLLRQKLNYEIEKMRNELEKSKKILLYC